MPRAETETTYAPLPDEAPRYALVVITNLGDAPLRYEGSVNLPGACLKACADHYVQTTIRGRSCIEDWCWTDCSGTAEPEGCEAGIRRCIQDNRATIRYYVDGRVMGGMPGGMVGLCPFFCSPLSGLDQPVPPSRGDDCSRWDRLLCGGACPSDKPAAFVRLRNWPAVECREIATGGRVRCN